MWAENCRFNQIEKLIALGDYEDLRKCTKSQQTQNTKLNLTSAGLLSEEKKVKKKELTLILS